MRNSKKKKKKMRRTKDLVVDLTNYATLFKIEFFQVFFHNGGHWGWAAEEYFDLVG